MRFYEQHLTEFCQKLTKTKEAQNICFLIDYF